jgi:hypothetical protein
LILTMLKNGFWALAKILEALLASQISHQPYRGGLFHSTGALILHRKHSRCLGFRQMLIAKCRNESKPGHKKKDMADEMVIKAYHRIDVTSDRKVPGQ